MENEQATHIFTTRFKILAVFFAVITAVVILSIQIKKPPQTFSPSVISPVATASASSTVKSRLFLKLANDRAIYLKDEPVKLTVYASSNGQDVTGFDAVINYDHNSLNFKKAISLNRSFDIVTNTKNNRLSITGVKKFSDETRTVFADSAILELAFTPQDFGKTGLAFDFTPRATNDSNLMAGKKDILAATSGIALYVGTEVILETNRPKIINGSLKITLFEAKIAPLDCRDCIESAKLEIEEGLGKSQFEFRVGGFAGFKQSFQEGLGYGFELDKIEKNRIKARFSTL